MYLWFAVFANVCSPNQELVGSKCLNCRFMGICVNDVFVGCLSPFIKHDDSCVCKFEVVDMDLVDEEVLLPAHNMVWDLGCNSDTQCGGGFCFDRVCQPYKPCQNNDDCLKTRASKLRFCVFGFCEAQLPISLEAACTDHAFCANKYPAKPYCTVENVQSVLGQCVECLSDNCCKNQFHCSPGSFKCVQCYTHDQCKSELCNIEKQECFQCSKNIHCTDPAKPNCDSVHLTCTDWPTCVTGEEFVNCRCDFNHFVKNGLCNYCYDENNDCEGQVFKCKEGYSVVLETCVPDQQTNIRSAMSEEKQDFGSVREQVGDSKPPITQDYKTQQSQPNSRKQLFRVMVLIFVILSITGIVTLVSFLVTQRNKLVHQRSLSKQGIPNPEK